MNQMRRRRVRRRLHAFENVAQVDQTALFTYLHKRFLFHGLYGKSAHVKWFLHSRVCREHVDLSL
jgi:hypothetical protein